MDDSGFPRTPDRLFKLSGTLASLSEVFGTMTGAGGPYNLGGSAASAPLLHHSCHHSTQHAAPEPTALRA